MGDRDGRRGGEQYLEESLLNSRIGDQPIVPKVLNEILVSGAGAAPGHGAEWLDWREGQPVCDAAEVKLRGQGKRSKDAQDVSLECRHSGNG